jgi:hypothetical protein
MSRSTLAYRADWFGGERAAAAAASLKDAFLVQVGQTWGWLVGSHQLEPRLLFLTSISIFNIRIKH